MTAQSLSNRIPVLSHRPGRRRGWLGIAIVGAVVVVAATMSVLALLSLLRAFSPRTHQLHMATDLVPRRVLLAEQIRDEASRHALDIVLTSRHYGSLEALEEVDSPSETKLALVPGGVKARDYPTVRLVATITTEPLHVLLRSDLAPKGLASLRGRRVAIGPPTTASHHVAREVIAFAGLRPTAEAGASGYTPVPTSTEELSRELQRIDALGSHDRGQAIQTLPDAVVFFAPIPSVLARQLVVTAGYALLPIPFAEAFLLERLNQPNSDGVRVDRSLLSTTTIPTYTYGFDPPMPTQPCSTVGVPLRLVARDDADPEAIFRLLETIYESPLTAAIRPPPLREQVSAFPLHVGTERFLHHTDPLLTGETASNLGKVIGGVGAFLSGLIALYGFLRLRKLSRFESYYHEIGRIEMTACGLEEDPAAPADPESLRAHLEGRLTTLKCEVLKDFAEGGLKGEGLMAGIIALINDTRESLARMMTVRNGARQGTTTDNGGAAHDTGLE